MLGNLDQIPLLFQLPPEVLGNISVYCFNDFRIVCRFMKKVAYPFLTIKTITRSEQLEVSALAKTQVNCLILGLPLNKQWKVGDINKLVIIACYKGDIHLSKWCINSSFNTLEYPRAFEVACKENKLELAKLFYDTNKDSIINAHAYHYFFGLTGICKNGNIEFIKWIFSFCINSSRTIHRSMILYWCLYYSCRYGQLKLAEWCVSQGADEFMGAFDGACLNGHLIMAKWCVAQMQKKQPNLLKRYICGAPPLGIDLSNGFTNACGGGHLEIVKWCYSQMTIDQAGLWFNKAVFDASRGGKLEVVNWCFIEALKMKFYVDFDQILDYAIYDDHPEIVKLCITYRTLYKDKFKN